MAPKNLEELEKEFKEGFRQKIQRKANDRSPHPTQNFQDRSREQIKRNQEKIDNEII